MICAEEFDRLADLLGTDKGRLGHAYGGAYSTFFRHLSSPPRVIVELGVGGRTFRGESGASLRLWRRLFPESIIVGIDNDVSCADVRCEGAEIIVAEQDDASLPARLSEATAGALVDVIIDDASHVPTVTIDTFRRLFPSLADGGLYIIEDTHCSYEEKFGAQRTEFERFLLWLVSSVDSGGQKLTPHNFQDYRKIADRSRLDFWQHAIESVIVRRGVICIRRRETFFAMR